MSQDKGITPEEIKRIIQGQYGKAFKLQVSPQPEGEETDEAGDETEERRKKALEFDFKPSQIKEYLDRFVIQQDDAKKVLATAVCDHYHYIQRYRGTDEFRDYKKQNIILIGPTGVGKTYLVQNIARLIGVPFVKADATKFSETGYVGGDVEDLVRELVHQAAGDIELAEYGIVYLDEIDKIAGTEMVGRDVSGHGVQRGLLKLMEDTEVPLRSPTDIAGQMQSLMEFQTKGRFEKKTISTKHILFIVSGAFNGLLEVIKKRIGAKQIGFREEAGSREEEHRLYGQARSVDFIEYGFEAEFIGRLPVIVHCNELTAEDLFHILKFSEGSLLKQYKRDFLAYCIDAYFNDDGMNAIAEAAVAEKTGARGLMTVCEKIFREFKYQLPDRPDIREFVVGAETVLEPQAKLDELLANPTLYRDQVIEFQLAKFEERFLESHGLKIKVSPEAALSLREKAEAAKVDPYAFIDALFDGFEHGLNLLRSGTPETAFDLTPEAVAAPSQAIDSWIREVYQQGSADEPVQG